MTLKTLRKRLASQARRAGICKEWRRKILNASSRQYLLQLFIRGVDFAIKNDFPDNELAAEFDDIAPAYGVFINREGKWRVVEKNRIIARDATICPAIFKGFAVAKVYALHGSTIEITASERAIVSVTVREGAKVSVTASDCARVQIFNYGGKVETLEKGEATIKTITS